MRALGPGSLSSFLKMVLDVTYYLLMALVAGALLLAIVGLLFSLNPGLLDGVDGAIRIQISSRAPIVIGGLLVAAGAMAGVLLIVGAQRRIFATLTAGDPFHPDNVGRLRLIALALAGLELGRYAVWAITSGTRWARSIRPEFSLTSWFSVLVVLVLAEVFREGARLRREAELTI